MKFDVTLYLDTFYAASYDVYRCSLQGGDDVANAIFNVAFTCDDAWECDTGTGLASEILAYYKQTRIISEINAENPKKCDVTVFLNTKCVIPVEAENEGEAVDRATQHYNSERENRPAYCGVAEIMLINSKLTRAFAELKEE
jgi:hypothetical protein